VTEAGSTATRHDFACADLADMTVTTSGTQGLLLWWPSLGASAVQLCGVQMRAINMLSLEVAGVGHHDDRWHHARSAGGRNGPGLALR
jgi:hypothetical protein